MHKKTERGTCRYAFGQKNILFVWIGLGKTQIGVIEIRSHK